MIEKWWHCDGFKCVFYIFVQIIEIIDFSR